MSAPDVSPVGLIKVVLARQNVEVGPIDLRAGPAFLIPNKLSSLAFHPVVKQSRKPFPEGEVLLVSIGDPISVRYFRDLSYLQAKSH